MILATNSEPEPEVLAWLKKNQDKYELIVNEKSVDTEPLPTDLICEANCFPDYHKFRVINEEDSSKKRKQDKDTTFKALPQDLSGERLKNGRTQMNQDIVEMSDSNGLLNAANAEILYSKFKHDGYLLFKGLLNKNEIMNARSSLLHTLRQLDVIDEEGRCKSDSGWTVDTQTGTLISGKNDYAEGTMEGLEGLWKEASQHPNLELIRDHSLLKTVLSVLALGKERNEKCTFRARTFSPNYSWLRIKAPNEFTTTHADIFYYKRYTDMFSNPEDDGEHLKVACCRKCKKADNEDQTLICDECDTMFHTYCLFPKLSELPKNDWYCSDCQQRPIFGTCWIPLGDTPVDHGVLAVLPGTQNLPNYYKHIKSPNAQISASYFKHGKDLTWHSSSFEAGDVVFFDSHLVHCTSRNKHSTYRLSLDFRWCLAPVGRKNYTKTYHSKFVHDMTADFSA